MPRTPTDEEVRGINAALRARTGDEDHEVDPSRVAVFDNYISDGPGYCGTVAVVLFGEPDYITGLTFHGLTRSMGGFWRVAAESDGIF